MMALTFRWVSKKPAPSTPHLQISAYGLEALEETPGSVTSIKPRPGLSPLLHQVLSRRSTEWLLSHASPVKHSRTAAEQSIEHPAGFLSLPQAGSCGPPQTLKEDRL